MIHKRFHNSVATLSFIELVLKSWSEWNHVKYILQWLQCCSLISETWKAKLLMLAVEMTTIPFVGESDLSC